MVLVEDKSSKGIFVYDIIRVYIASRNLCTKVKPPWYIVVIIIKNQHIIGITILMPIKYVSLITTFDIVY